MRDRDDVTDREDYRTWKGKVSERRRWERYPPGEGVRVQLDGYTFKLMDIGFGGLSLHNHGEKALPEEGALTLHCQIEGFYLNTLRYRKISEYHFFTRNSLGRVKMHRTSLELLDTDPDLVSRLVYFMKKKERELWEA